MPLKCSLGFNYSVANTPIKHNLRSDVCGWEAKLITKEQMSQLS